jgi:predicted nucleic acid-binding protein
MILATNAGIVADTTLVQELILRDPAKQPAAWLSRAMPFIEDQPLFCSFISRAEVIFGAMNAQSSEKRIDQIVTAFENFNVIWPNELLTRRYAELRAGLPKGHALRQESEEGSAPFARWHQPAGAESVRAEQRAEVSTLAWAADAAT